VAKYRDTSSKETGLLWRAQADAPGGRWDLVRFGWIQLVGRCCSVKAEMSQADHQCTIQHPTQSPTHPAASATRRRTRPP
jgi:hypothetical protein